jgi:hypothetical protein
MSSSWTLFVHHALLVWQIRTWQWDEVHKLSAFRYFIRLKQFEVSLWTTFPEQGSLGDRKKRSKSFLTLWSWEEVQRGKWFVLRTGREHACSKALNQRKWRSTCMQFGNVCVKMEYRKKHKNVCTCGWLLLVKPCSVHEWKTIEEHLFHAVLFWRKLFL